MRSANANVHLDCAEEDQLDKWPYYVQQRLADESQVLDHGESQFLGVVLHEND